jgi:AcrR family transcriptional regulator
MKKSLVPRLPPPRRAYKQVARAVASQETEQRILEAATALFSENYYDHVTLEAVAERAGVTLKTVQRRFGGKQGLARAFILAGAKHNAELRDRVPAGDAALALDFIVGMYEAIGDSVMRTLALDGRVEVVTEMAQAGRELHWQWLQRVFEPLLSKSPERRSEQLALLLAATDVYTWKLFRRDRKLDPAQTLKLLQMLVDAALQR